MPYKAFKLLSARLKIMKLRYLPRQIDLLRTFFKKGGVLIILDACRYDFFKKYYLGYLGYTSILFPAYSPASNTFDWLKIVSKRYFAYLRFTRIFSATPAINSKGIEIYGFKPTECCRDIIDVWKYYWDPDLQTVHPYSVVEAVKKYGLKKRNIIWFVQPHMPYIGEIKIIRPNKSFRNSESYLLYLLNRGEITVQEWIDAYVSNLKLVLKAVGKLLSLIPKKKMVIITADHGELFGEYGIFFHPHRYTLPQLRIVPFVVLKMNKKILIRTLINFNKK